MMRDFDLSKIFLNKPVEYGKRPQRNIVTYSFQSPDKKRNSLCWFWKVGGEKWALGCEGTTII